MAKRRTLKHKINELTKANKELTKANKELQNVCDDLKVSNNVLKRKVESTAKMDQALHYFANGQTEGGLKLYNELYPNVMGTMM